MVIPLKFRGTYDAVIEAIQTAIPYLNNVGFDNYWLELTADCTLEDQPTRRLPYSLMSDGLKRVLGIVADIAYRCVILNGFLEREAVRLSKGVVMIDEFDMHLHPSWQRKIVADLRAAFPNLQFVTTTHSPFIVQSLDSSELINLDQETDVQPKDLSLEEVVSDIMGLPEAYAEDNQQAENLSHKYLSTLELVKKGDAPLTEPEHELLNEIESKISDPSIFAFLQMKRLELTAGKEN